MSPKQKTLYWREWGRVRKIQPDADRHELHRQALGADKSSKAFNNRDLDRILGVFRAISQPADVDAQLRQQAMARTRALHAIFNHPADYVQAICLDRFGTDDLDQLDDTQAAQLAMTLAIRRRAATKRAEATATLVVPETADCPF